MGDQRKMLKNCQNYTFLENMNFMVDMEKFYNNLKIINLYSFKFWIYLLELQLTREVTFSLRAKF